MKKQRILSVGLTVILPLLLIIGVIEAQGSGPVGVRHADWKPLVPLNGLLVTFPGDFVSELGGTDWDPADTTTQAGDVNSDQVWIFRSTDIPSGTWTFKATVGGTWDETYGAGGQPNGPSIAFTATAGVTVSLYYDRRDHYVTSRPDTRIPVIAGDFLSEMGGVDWDPANLTGWLKDKDGDRVYTWLAHNVPGGRWYYKVALNESMAENYGAGGVPGGSSMVLNVPAGGADVLFEYNDNTHLVSARVLVHGLGFAPAVIFEEMPNNVQAVGIGDLDHDGRLDIVSGDAGSKNIIAWRNDGTPFDGNWSGNVIGAAMGAVEGLALADLDRDGDLDAISVDDAGYLTLYQNNGTPFEGTWSTTQKSGAYPLYSILTADLDKDGWIDLLTGGHPSYLYELLGWRNTGDPFNPGAWSASNIGQPSSVYALAAADIDYDGDIDLAAGGVSQDITIWENDGSPFNDVWVHNNVGSASNNIHALALNDIDRDGDLDIVSASETDAGESAVQLWLNDRHDPGSDYDPFTGTWTKRDIGATDRFGYGVAILDIDRDGDVDIIAALNTGEGNLSGWANDEYGTVWKACSLDGSDQTLLALAAADLDGDGDADLVGGSDAHKLLGWENLNLADEWGNWTEYPSPNTEKPFAGLATGDFNGDSWTDIAAARPDGGIYLWRYDVISHWIELPASPLVLTNVVDVAVGQIMTGTGNENNQDLVAASDGYGLRAWFVSERGTVWDPASTGLPTSGKYTAITLGDVNRDGNLDIIAAGGSGIRYYRNNGWSWVAGTAVTTTDVYSAVVVADINHDAYLDVMGTAKSGEILIWLGNGGTAWDWIGRIGELTFSALAVGDLNRDGNPDLAAASPEKGCMLWFGNGTGKFGTAKAPECPDGIRAIALNDYDLDGDLDWSVAGFKGITLYRQQVDGSWLESGENLPQGESNYRDASFAHIDHDGALDLIASEDASGMYVWTAREPPPGFSNFQPGYPQRWLTTQTPLCSVEATDIGSGLDVEGGAWYQYSTDNGSTWSAWQNAIITGTNVVSGTHGPVQLWATPTFTESTNTQSRNKIRFRMYDMAGNLGISPDYGVWVDTVAPNNPIQIYSTDHTEGSFSNDTSLTFQWSGGTDATSGVIGYYWRLTNSMTNTETPHLMGHAYVQGVTLYAGEGTWYFHLATQDFAGNWAAQARRGPYWIDTSLPTTPTLLWSSQVTNTWSNNDVISVTMGDHDNFGIAGYSFNWSQAPLGWVDETADTTSNMAVSGHLDDGRWYLHARSVDLAGNISEIAHFGPFGVDVSPPSGCSISSPSLVNNTSFPVSWYCQDTCSGVQGYDVQVRRRITETWTNWQTWQTLTMTTYTHYTGAEHLRTYQFRARAHDVAGNVTGYFTSTETLVQLSPSIASYTPNTGFASAGRNVSPTLQVVPGTMVAITGTAFAPTATVYFRGVAMEPTTSQVVNENLIHAVVGIGTPTGSGQMCVRTRFGQDCEPFEVVGQPFPVRWGLGFNNFSTSSNDMTWRIFEKAFGKCEVNFCLIPNPFTGLPLPCEWCPSDDLLIPRWDADVFFRASRTIAENGDCYGFSYLTMDFYKGVKSPGDFAAGADIPASLRRETPNLIDEIRARHWRQLSMEALAAELDAIAFYEMYGPMAMLDTRMSYLNPPSAILCMQRGLHGHCIVPYDVNREPTTAYIHVYDNNFSYIVDHDLAVGRVITVGATSWEYPDWGGNIWGNYYILLPYSIVAGPHHLPTDILGLDIIFGSSAGHSRVQDAQDRMIGYDESGQFTQTIPISDAMRIIPFMDGTPPFEGYYLPRPGDYTIHVSGTAGGTYSMTLFGDGGTGLSLQDVSLEPTTRDAIDFGQHSATGESFFALITSDTGKPITLTLLRQVNNGNGERSFALQDLELGSGSPLTLTTANGARSLIIGGGLGNDYDLCLHSVGAGLAPSEFCWSDIHLTAGDRHILTPQDWEHLNVTQVRLDIDHGNDDTIDETRWLEGHGLALSMSITPTIVRSGNLLTYTLGYTVTGSEMAPGAVLTATLPHSVTFISATAGATPAGNVLTWSLGDLAPSTTGQVTFTVQVNPVPDDVIIGNLAYLRDTSGRWAMVCGAAVGPEFGRRKLYLPLILKQ